MKFHKILLYIYAILFVFNSIAQNPQSTQTSSIGFFITPITNFGFNIDSTLYPPNTDSLLESSFFNAESIENLVITDEDIFTNSNVLSNIVIIPFSFDNMLNNNNNALLNNNENITIPDLCFGGILVTYDPLKIVVFIIDQPVEAGIDDGENISECHIDPHDLDFSDLYKIKNIVSNLELFGDENISMCAEENILLNFGFSYEAGENFTAKIDTD